jgi:DNA-binding HxlR family transcriptional regulator
MSDYQQFCGLARALDLVGDRWNLLLVRELLIAPRRHHELKAALPGIASNLLAERLRHLTAAGVVHREDEVGRKAVRYRLTDLGEGLREPILGLVRWGAAVMGAGPRPTDVVQPQWLGLALEAFLDPIGPTTTRPLDPCILVRAGDLEFTVRPSHATSRVVLGRADRPDATLTASPAVVLGLFSGALTPDSPAAASADLDDPHGLLTGLLAAAAGRTD